MSETIHSLLRCANYSRGGGSMQASVPRSTISPNKLNSPAPPKLGLRFNCPLDLILHQSLKSVCPLSSLGQAQGKAGGCVWAGRQACQEQPQESARLHWESILRKVGASDRRSSTLNPTQQPSMPCQLVWELQPAPPCNTV